MMTLHGYRQDPVAFIDRFVRRDEKGEAWTLSPHQRSVLRLALSFDTAGRLLLRLLLWSEMKKSGKTFVAALVVLWWGFTRAHSEIIVAANDLEQSTGRVFKTVVALLEQNADLKRSGRIKAQSIALTNGTTIRAIASDYRGEAGSRHSLAVFDELWGYDSERAQRLFEELTPPPTEPDAWLLIVTTAGFSGESHLLERLYERGLAGTRLDEELEIYRADDLVMFWSHTPRQPWQTPEYYEQQRRLLRPSTYLRLHENRWAVAHSAFITPELWDACVDTDLHPALKGDQLPPLIVGVDAATKHDTAAVVAVTWVDDTLRLVTHRIWTPSPSEPLDLEATIERYLRELWQRFPVARIVIDPWQMVRSITTLRSAGLPVEELPQTTATTTAMGQTLFEVLSGRRVMLYQADDLRTQALNTVAIETPRGWRIAKEKASRKIDAISALAMACFTAVQIPRVPPPRPISTHTPSSELTAAERAAVDAKETKQATEYLKRALEREGVWWPSSGRGDMGDGWR